MRSVITWTFDRLRGSSRDAFASTGSSGLSGPRTSRSSSWAGELHGQQTGREWAALTLDPSTLSLPAAFLIQRPAVGGRPPDEGETLAVLGGSWAPRRVQRPHHGQAEPGLNPDPGSPVSTHAPLLKGLTPGAQLCPPLAAHKPGARSQSSSGGFVLELGSVIGIDTLLCGDGIRELSQTRGSAAGRVG